MPPPSIRAEQAVPALAAVVKPYMDGYVQFLTDFTPTFTATEASVYTAHKSTPAP